MAKLGLSPPLAAIVGALSFASMSSSTADDKAKNDCVKKEYKTELVKNACEKGGQKEAKAVMQAWNKEKKLKSCNQCHTKLAPKYELKADAVEQFVKLGGKLLDAPKK